MAKEKNQKNTQVKRKNRGSGFVFRLITAITFCLLIAIVDYFSDRWFYGIGGSPGRKISKYIQVFSDISFSSHAFEIIFPTLAPLVFILAFEGNRSRGANIAFIVFSVIFILFSIIPYVDYKEPLFAGHGIIPGILGIIGGVRGKRYVKAQAEQGGTAQAPSTETQGQAQAETPSTEAQVQTETQPTAEAKTAEAQVSVPQEDIERIQKEPNGLLAQIVNQVGKERLVYVIDDVTGQLNTVYANQFAWLYSTVRGTTELYVALKQERSGDDVYIARYVREEDKLYAEDDAVAEKVYLELKEKMERRAQAEGQGATGEVLKLDLYDTVVRKKDWKQFKKQASQEELMVLAIGAKYRTTGKQFFLKALISVLGTILSIILGFALANSVGFFALVILVGGYGFFGLMASKLSSYDSTYRDCRRLLTKENRAYVESLFPKSKVIVKILRHFVEMGLTFFTIPYQAILMFIGVMVPSLEDWTIAHGAMGDGIVVSIPQGYDVGDLGAIGAYYEGKKFYDGLEQHLEEDKQRRAQEATKRLQEQQGGNKQLTYYGTAPQPNGDIYERYQDGQGRFYVSDGKNVWEDK